METSKDHQKSKVDFCNYIEPAWMCSRTNAYDIELKQVEGYSDVTLEHLREVKLNYVFGVKCEMQLIELILAKAPVLQKFVIEPAFWLYNYEKLRVLNKVSMFRRASPLVEVACGD